MMLITVQVVSDFGFFGRKKAEEFLGGFEDTYCLKQLRLSGDSIRCGMQIIKDDSLPLFAGKSCASCSRRCSLLSHANVIDGMVASMQDSTQFPGIMAGPRCQ